MIVYYGGLVTADDIVEFIKLETDDKYADSIDSLKLSEVARKYKDVRLSLAIYCIGVDSN